MEQQNNTKTEEIIIGQTNNWLETEEAALKTPLTFEKKPALKLETGKITSFEINFEKPFEIWNTENNGKKITKAIIPVKHENIDKILWLNKHNPVFAEIIHAGRTGQKTFKIFTSGTQADTKYSLVKE